MAPIGAGERRDLYAGTADDGTADNAGSSRSEAMAPAGAGERSDLYAGTAGTGTARDTGCIIAYRSFLK